MRRFVYHSVLHPQIEAMPHHWTKLRVEEMLLASGLDVTFLQPTAYMQNILAGWRSITEEGVYRVPYPVETRISLVDLRDVARGRGAGADRARPRRRHLRAGRHRALDPGRGGRRLGAALGRPVRAVAEPVEAWDARARAAGMGDYQRETLAAMFRSYAANGLVGNANVLGWLLGRPPATLAQFAADAVGAVGDLA